MLPMIEDPPEIDIIITITIWGFFDCISELGRQHLQ